MDNWKNSMNNTNVIDIDYGLVFRFVNRIYAHMGVCHSENTKKTNKQNKCRITIINGTVKCFMDL